MFRVFIYLGFYRCFFGIFFKKNTRETFGHFYRWVLFFVFFFVFFFFFFFFDDDDMTTSDDDRKGKRFTGLRSKKSEKLFFAKGHLSTIRVETPKTLSSTLFFVSVRVCVFRFFSLVFFCISLPLAIKIHAKARDESVERRRCARARFFRRAMMTSVVKC